MKALLIKLDALLNKAKAVDFIAPLMLRLYLVPIFWMAGMSKVESFDSTVQWFGNEQWGLGLPFPLVLAFLATAAEVIGAIALLIGLAVRWLSIPLMVTMFIAATSVHLDNGWQAISDANAPFANERVMQAADKLAIVNNVLEEHTKYDYITSSGKVVILNNGIEFSVTYFIMLLALFFLGGGRYVSLDYWFKRKLLL